MGTTMREREITNSELANVLMCLHSLKVGHFMSRSMYIPPHTHQDMLGAMQIYWKEFGFYTDWFRSFASMMCIEHCSVSKCQNKGNRENSVSFDSMH